MPVGKMRSEVEVESIECAESFGTLQFFLLIFKGGDRGYTEVVHEYKEPKRKDQDANY